MNVISNSSPLINFSALKRLDILQTFYGNIFIPAAVFREVVVAGQRHLGASEVSQADWIVQKPIMNIVVSLPCIA